MTHRFGALALLLLASASAFAQVTPSGSPRVQGTGSPTRGDPVNVVITDGSGNLVSGSGTPTGTAGSPNAAVVTVQGIASGTAQPVSAASLPLPTGAATSAAQTTAATSNGAPGDTVCSSDTASCSANAQRQRTNQRLTSIIGVLGSPFQAFASIGNTVFGATQSGTWNITTLTGGGVASGAADSGNPLKVGGRYNSTLPTLTDGQRGDFQVGTRGALNTQIMLPNALAVTSQAAGADAVSNTFNTYLGTALNQVFNGTTWDRARGDTNGIVTQPALSASFWSYAAVSGGIVNSTTAVTVHAAAGGTLRNYLTTITISHDTLGAVTEIACRDGAAGTVLWRGRLQTPAVEDVAITFTPPLRGTANTLTECLTLTAVTGGVWINAQGYTGN